jgi:hypothetical protein
VSALLIPLHTIRHAVQQSQRMGMPETRQDVIARVLADLRDPRHPQHQQAPGRPQ